MKPTRRQKLFARLGDASRAVERASSRLPFSMRTRIIRVPITFIKDLDPGSGEILKGFVTVLDEDVKVDMEAFTAYLKVFEDEWLEPEYVATRLLSDLQFLANKALINATAMSLELEVGGQTIMATWRCGSRIKVLS